MARRTKEEAQQTRCHIMSTALDLFCSQGLAKTSLTDIARAADLTRGAIYWHFKNKDELFISLWQELCSPLAHQLDACLNPDEPDPLGQLRLFFEGVLHSFIHNPAQRQMFTILFNLESLEGGSHLIARAYPQPVRQLLSRPGDHPGQCGTAGPTARQPQPAARRHPAPLHSGWLHHQLAPLSGADRPAGRIRLYDREHVHHAGPAPRACLRPLISSGNFLTSKSGTDRTFWQSGPDLLPCAPPA